jgi:hypothetical protein
MKQIGFGVLAADDGSGEDLGKPHLLNDSYPDNYYYFDIYMPSAPILSWLILS